MSKKGSNKLKECRNCSVGLSIEQNYCPNCGQKNDSRRLSISEYITESLGNFFSFDTKIIQSLIPFFTKPGMLSRKYVDGQKVKYVVPFRMYMFFSLLFFLVAGALQDKSKFDDFFKQDLPNDLQLNGQVLGQVDTIFADSSVVVLDSNAVNNYEKFSFSKAFNYAKKHPDSSATAAIRDLRFDVNIENIRKYDIYLKWVRMDRLEFMNGLLDKLPLLIFLFMPLLAIVMKFLYIRRDVYYSEHLTFLLQTNSMLFLLATVEIIIRKLVMIDFLFPFFCGFALYFLFAMKIFYKQGWPKTFIKFLLAGFFVVPIFIAFGLLAIWVIYYFY